MKKLLIGLTLLATLLNAGFISADPAPVYRNPKAPLKQRVDDLLQRMTLKEKIGQMTQIDHTFLRNIEDISTFGLGSMLSGGNSNISDLTASGWATYYDLMQKQALKSRLGIPLLYGIDAVHGNAKIEGATIFPHNVGLGATHNPKLVEKVSRATAEEVAATGMDWTFSPCVTVPQNERWGRTYEGFSENPKLVSELGAAAVRGYQTAKLGSTPTSIMATAKHFVADGGTDNGTDQGDARMTEQTLRQIHLPPYLDAIKNNVGSIMVSYSSWNGEKLHGHQHLIRDVLRKELGFEGITVSDWAAIKQLGGGPSAQVEHAVNAGIDMVMVPDDYELFIDTLTELVTEGKVKQETIDDAVRHILTAKFKLGLFEQPLARKDLATKVGSAEHRALARQAVRESMVLLKNEKNFLPLSKQLKTLYVTGGKADDVGAQSGGWTLSWQGRHGPIPGGTSILDAIRHSVSKETKVLYSSNGKKAAGAEAAIIVVGEDPYAEGQGDRSDLALDEYDQTIIKNVQAAGVPYVIVLLSGRPMIVTDEVANSRAFIAAWLPGTEGQGVVDVLFGDYAPTGKLAYTWPKDMGQIPINLGDDKTGALFPYGFGLTYTK